MKPATALVGIQRSIFSGLMPSGRHAVSPFSCWKSNGISAQLRVCKMPRVCATA